MSQKSTQVLDRASAPPEPELAPEPTEVASSAFPDAGTAVPREERIAQRAYELYCQRGNEHGQDVDDWLQAEREVDSLL